MSDIAVVEIPSPPAQPETPPAETKASPKQKGEWSRTRFCCCPDSAATDCRFHSQKEPGWETCPWEKRSGKGNGRWLWARGSHDLVSEEQLSVGADIKELPKAQQHAADKYLH